MNSEEERAEIRRRLAEVVAAAEAEEAARRAAHPVRYTGSDLELDEMIFRSEEEFGQDSRNKEGAGE